MNGLDGLETEARNPTTVNIDLVPTVELCRMINNEDKTIAHQVSLHIETISSVIDHTAIQVGRGGRVIQLGAGTSGRLGVLDASEIPPTYSAPAGLYVGLIAGGDFALRNPVEGAEDLREHGSAALKDLEPPLSPLDTVIGIAASGRTPYVLGALEYARAIGCHTVGVCCVRNSAFRIEGHCQFVIECVVGAEVVTGSSRMKAGTATKMILNMISTGVMIRTGKTYGNLMVDLRALNHKLVVRARRVLRTIVIAASEDFDKRGASLRSRSHLDLANDAIIDDLLQRCSGSLKVATLVYLLEVSVPEAVNTLEQKGGRLKECLMSALG